MASHNNTIACNEWKHWYEEPEQYEYSLKTTVKAVDVTGDSPFVITTVIYIIAKYILGDD